MNLHLSKTARRSLRISSLLIISAGIFLRLYVYLQNRNLMVDELNVVRNVFERDFSDLLQPLDYQQYAPPLFLWMLKLCGIGFGYSEQAMRLYPLLASFVALGLLYFILRRLEWAGIPALCSFAFSAFIIRYSTDVKQYLPDAMIALALLALATKVSITTQATRFLLIWVFAGLLSMLLSMPAVFLLLGIGLYYLDQASRSHLRKQMLSITVTGLCWLLVFLVYYQLILRYQIGSDYLQSWHRDYFMELGSGIHVMKHDARLMASLLNAIAGTDCQAVLGLYGILFSIGVVHMARHARGMLILTLIPVLTMLVASCFKMFTLLPRVCIFSIPLCLIIIAYGLQMLFRHWPRYSREIAIVLSIASCVTVNPVYLLANKLEVDELSTSVAFAQAHNVALNHIYLNSLVTPSVVYYSSIHPAHEKYQSYTQLSTIPENAQLDSFSQALMKDKSRYAFVYYWIDDATLDAHRRRIFARLRPVDSLVKTSYRVMIFEAL